MKHRLILRLLIGIAVVLASACTPDRNALYLEKAEHYRAHGRGDSVYYYLNRVDSNAVKGEDRYTYRRLNLFFQLFRNPLKENLCIAHELTEHYRQRHDSVRLKKMANLYFEIYLQGEAYAEADSIASMQLAEAIRRKDHNAIDGASFRKSRVFEATGQTDSALHYLNKQLALQESDGNKAFYYGRMTDLLLKAERLEEGKALLDSAIVCAKRAGEEASVYSYLLTYANVLSREGQYKHALAKLEESRTYRKRSDVAAYNMYKANYHELMQQTDSALHYYGIVARSGNAFLSSEAHLRLARFSESEGADSIAFRRQQDAMSHFSQVNHNYNWEAENARYEKLQLKAEIGELKIARQRQIIISLSLAFTLLAGMSGFAFYHQRKKRKEAERFARMESERLKQAEELNRMTEKATRLREELLLRRMSAFKKLPSLDAGAEEDKLSDRQIVLTDADWREIRRAVDSNYDGFTLRLRKEYPLLTENDIRLCCLIKINVSLHDMSNVYCISKASVSRKKLRMKEKFNIAPSDGISLDEFIQRF